MLCLEDNLWCASVFFHLSSRECSKCLHLISALASIQISSTRKLFLCPTHIFTHITKQKIRLRESAAVIETIIHSLGSSLSLVIHMRDRSFDFGKNFDTSVIAAILFPPDYEQNDIRSVVNNLIMLSFLSYRNISKQ